MAVPLAVLVVVGGLLRWVVAGQDLFADELATYWVVSTRGLSGVVETVSTTAEISPPFGFVLSWFTTRIGLEPGAGAAPGVGRRDRFDPARLRGRSPHRGPRRGVGGRDPDDAEPVHDLLLGRGAGIWRADGPAPAVDADPADRGRGWSGPLVGGLRGVRVPGGLHALHGGVRAGGSAWLGVLGASAGAAAAAAVDGAGGAGVRPLAAEPQGRHATHPPPTSSAPSRRPTPDRSGSRWASGASGSRPPTSASRCRFRFPGRRCATCPGSPRWCC